MGGCSCGDKDMESVQGFSAGGGRIFQLVKVDSIEEANRLLKEEDHIYLGVFWNNKLSGEEYILGKTERDKKTARKVGFCIE
jgi:hypothetical protein